METSEQEHTANIARLQQLAADARKKSAAREITANGAGAYWAGLSDGLLRAVRILEGRG